MIRVLASGQSNMVGRGTGGPDWSIVHSDVRVWNNVNPLGANGTAFTDAATARAGGTFDLTDRNNLGVWFCDRLARHLGESVDFTMVARGGTSIENWSPGGDDVDMLQELIDVWTATGQAPANVFIWHQGEGNLTYSYEDYSSLFLALIANLTTAGVIDASTIVIVGGVAETQEARADFNRRVLQPMAAANSNIFYARADGLTVYDVTTHFDGWALTTFGHDRFFNAFMEAMSAMPDLWALVNNGGTPGEAGTGTPGLVNLGPVMTAGYRLKGPPLFLTADQTYAPADDVAAIYVELVGGGGGGGGSPSSSSIARSASGGGYGGYAAKFIENPDASYDVVIGAGGTGGAAGANNGTAGGTTTFGVSLSATGGGYGITHSSSQTAVLISSAAADGGVGSGGDTNLRGQAGGVSSKVTEGSRLGGSGGSGKFGLGGVGRVLNSASSSVAGEDGTGYGSGGSGGCSSTTVDVAGGNGAPGLVVVWEFLKG